jgi:hypothetical protein
MKKSLLPEFDNVLMDGLEFCFRTYLLFEQIRSKPDGASTLRLRPTRREKLLLEELLPICKYVQMNYKPGRYISVRWVDGNQSYDAEVEQHGAYVQETYYPAHSFFEVTGVNHPKEHMIREVLEKKGAAFGHEGLKRIKGEVVSEPVGYKYREHVDLFFKLLTDGIAKKLKKTYPPRTTLIVECSLNTIFMSDEWDDLMRRLGKDLQVTPFSEIFVYDRVGQHSKSFFAPPLDCPAALQIPQGES